MHRIQRFVYDRSASLGVVAFFCRFVTYIFIEARNFRRIILICLLVDGSICFYLHYDAEVFFVSFCTSSKDFIRKLSASSILSLNYNIREIMMNDYEH